MQLFFLKSNISGAINLFVTLGVKKKKKKNYRKMLKIFFSSVFLPAVSNTKLLCLFRPRTVVALFRVRAVSSHGLPLHYVRNHKRHFN